MRLPTARLAPPPPSPLQPVLFNTTIRSVLSRALLAVLWLLLCACMPEAGWGSGMARGHIVALGACLPPCLLSHCQAACEGASLPSLPTCARFWHGARHCIGTDRVPLAHNTTS